MVRLPDTVILTTSCLAREKHLVATLGAAMASVTQADFVVQHYGEMSTTTHSLLKVLAEGTSNHLTVNSIAEDVPVAHTKVNFTVRRGDASRLFTVEAPPTQFINLDDDLLVPESAWLAFAQHRDSVFTVGVVDANGSRGYSDYDNSYYWGLTDYLSNHELSKAKHHRFRTQGLIQNYNWLSQLYALPAYVYADPSIWSVILQEFTVRGVRGYDIMLEQLLGQAGHSITLGLGREATHFGLETPFQGGNWTAQHPVVAEAVSLK